MADSSWLLSRRFDEALAYAAHVHEGHCRKGTTVPYLAHLLGVCALVLEDGGSEEEAIAALLHDAVEDAGGEGRLRAIRRRFGERVAAIVAACSDTDESPKPPWRERKQRYLAHLVAERDPGTLRVAAADKLHNATAILRDYRRVGESLWERFSAPAAEQMWYYRALVDAFRAAGEGPLVGELERVVDELERLWRTLNSYTNE
ncbi:MAG TPA: HD domain-containing protein [Vicinamibacteria bacterium]|nr:HD domain-containing protein [Vicinamibacteria bacterium]